MNKFILAMILFFIVFIAVFLNYEEPIEKIECFNNTINNTIINNTEYVEIIKYENCTNETKTEYITVNDSTYVTNLIRQLKYCESRLNISWDYTSCSERLEECNSTITRIEEILR